MENHSGQKGIEFPKRYRVAKIVYRVTLKQQNDTENRVKTSRILHFQKYHIEMTQNNMSRIYNKITYRESVIKIKHIENS